MKYHIVIALIVASATGCAAQKTKPPEVSLDEPVRIEPLPDPPKPIEVVRVPEPLPLPSQLKPLIPAANTKPDSTDPRERVADANAAARVAPTLDGYVNAVQVWPYSEGSLYQVYASPGRITDIMLQSGEDLVAVSAGDTTRWIVGDTTSAAGAAQRVHVLIKPVRPDLKTNLLITTNRRTYLLELTATTDTWMASVSWEYPHDRLAALRAETQRATAAAPIAQGIPLERLRFRYDISGDTPSWRPLRAFDDGQHVYIQFPAAIAQGELPPLFVIGASGDAELVNYRYRAPYYIVDRLFGAAELRLGGDAAQRVRISRNDAPRG